MPDDPDRDNWFQIDHTIIAQAWRGIDMATSSLGCRGADSPGLIGKPKHEPDE
jgi:hypothetical protein